MPIHVVLIVYVPLDVPYFGLGILLVKKQDPNVLQND